MIRKAMGLWQAIMMILLVSGMMIVVLKYAAISAKHVSDSYVREQAELYLNSIVEMTLLEISKKDRSAGCLSSFSPPPITKRATTYTSSVDIQTYYLLAGNIDETYCGASLTTPITTAESHGMVVLNIEVNATVDGELKTRIVRRTLQRP